MCPVKFCDRYSGAFPFCTRSICVCACVYLNSANNTTQHNTRTITTMARAKTLTHTQAGKRGAPTHIHTAASSHTYTHIQCMIFIGVCVLYDCIMYTHVLCMLFSLHRTRTNLSSRFDDCCCCCRFFFFLVHLRRLSFCLLLQWLFFFFSLRFTCATTRC